LEQLDEKEEEEEEASKIAFLPATPPLLDIGMVLLLMLLLLVVVVLYLLLSWLPKPFWPSCLMLCKKLWLAKGLRLVSIGGGLGLRDGGSSLLL
jgi:apolipoprotein N-acyltransferase